MIKRFIIAATTAATLAATASAQELRMTVWTGSDAHLSMLGGFADSFAAENPGVTVKFETIPFGDYVQSLTLQLAGSNPPDLGWLLESSAPTFVQAGVLLDVGDKLRGDAAYDFADFSEPAMSLWQSGDAINGIPFSTSPLVVLYNASMFEAAGLETPNEMAAEGKWTWDAMRTSAAALAGDGVYGFESMDGRGYGNTVLHTLMPIVRSYGGEAWSSGACGLNSAAAKEAITLYHNMIFADGAVVPPGEQANFFTGGAAMTVSQISRVSKLADADFEWDLAPLPTGPAGAAPVIGQAGLVAFASGNNTELAADFLAHMTSVDNVTTMAQFFPPARNSVLNGEVFLNSNKALSPMQMGIVADAIATGKILPSHPKFPQIQAAMRPKFDALWQADADVEAVLDSVCAAIESLL
ncbi:MAG: sugar ABC transporter substrate-binding protein [Pseudomonadota bacterium]